MLENLNFQSTVSTDLPKFVPNPNMVNRAAALHYADADNKLHPIVIGAMQHFHGAEGGLKGFQCHSTDKVQAICCKHPGIFQAAAVKVALPILVYATDFQGNPIPGMMPSLQVLVIGSNPWDKLKTIDKAYPLCQTDFSITGKKLQMGFALDFSPVGPALWQQDPALFAHFLAVAKGLVEGSGKASLEKMLAKVISLADIENAIRVSQGMPPSMPTPGGFGGAPMPMMVPPAPMAYPTPPAPMAIPIPQGMSVPTPPMGAGPVSPAQLSALSSLLPPKE